MKIQSLVFPLNPVLTMSWLLNFLIRARAHGGRPGLEVHHVLTNFFDRLFLGIMSAHVVDFTGQRGWEAELFSVLRFRVETAKLNVVNDELDNGFINIIIWERSASVVKLKKMHGTWTKETIENADCRGLGLLQSKVNAAKVYVLDVTYSNALLSLLKTNRKY